jgi:putative tryptophan/tyrosine transport system substrate-binding protein
MMDRRPFLCGLTLGALSGSVVSQALQPARVHRIGGLRSLPPNDPSMAAFRQALLDLGYFEGKDFLIEYRSAEGQPEGLADLAVELQRLKADVLVVEGTPLSLAAKQAIGSTPIVFAAVADAVGSGLVVSRARPGGNITELSFLGPDTVGKHLQLLKEAVPRISRVAILSHPGNPSEATRRVMLKEAEVAARALENGSSNSRQSIGFRQCIRGGNLWMQGAYGPNIPALFRRAAYCVHRILKGSKAGDLPVEQPTKFDMVINLKTAEALGLTIPQTLLQRADQVIQ